jgi:hypothetical protein
VINVDAEGEKSLVFAGKAAAFTMWTLFVFTMGACGGYREGYRDMRIQAVGQGSGEWVVDTNGIMDFRWKPINQRALPPKQAEVQEYIEKHNGSAPPANWYPNGDPWRGITAKESAGFHNPATAEDYEHMHDYLQPKEKTVNGK